MDFIGDLPDSSGFQVNWVVVDRFCKMAHFVSLAQLPSPRTFAILFLHHVFSLLGLPQDIVLENVLFLSKH